MAAAHPLGPEQGRHRRGRDQVVGSDPISAAPAGRNQSVMSIHSALDNVVAAAIVSLRAEDQRCARSRSAVTPNHVATHNV
jgi:hypothetical protein